MEKIIKNEDYYKLDFNDLNEVKNNLNRFKIDIKEIPQNLSFDRKTERLNNIIFFTQKEIDNLIEKVKQYEDELSFRKEATNRYKNDLPLTIEETAYIKNVSYQTVRNWYIKEGLPVNRMGKGSKVTVNPETLDEWLQAQNI